MSSPSVSLEVSEADIKVAVGLSWMALALLLASIGLALEPNRDPRAMFAWGMVSVPIMVASAYLLGHIVVDLSGGDDDE